MQFIRSCTVSGGLGLRGVGGDRQRLEQKYIALLNTFSFVLQVTTPTRYICARQYRTVLIVNNTRIFFKSQRFNSIFYADAFGGYHVFEATVACTYNFLQYQFKRYNGAIRSREIYVLTYLLAFGEISETSTYILRFSLRLLKIRFSFFRACSYLFLQLQINKIMK